MTCHHNSDRSGFHPDLYIFFFSSRRRHTRFKCDWSSDVCSSDLPSSGSAKDTVGFDSFHMSEHVAMYKGAKLGGVTFDPTVSFADPLEVLAFVAARTERILLGTAILQLPLHHPVMLAKRLPTIDVLSIGRMRLLTLGLGSLPRESEALTADPAPPRPPPHT